MKQLLLTGALVFLATGCVSKSEYDRQLAEWRRQMREWQPWR